MKFTIIFLSYLVISKNFELIFGILRNNFQDLKF